VDGWKTTLSTSSRSVGSAGFSADIVPGIENGVLQWTFHWLEQDSWLGHNIDIKIEAR
jgi:hypothetical protein